MANIQKEELYQKLKKKYGKVLTDNLIKYTILGNDIETAKQILAQTYKEEYEYNERNKDIL